MNDAEKALSALIRESLFGIKAELPADTDWGSVLAEAKAQTVVSIAAKAVPKEFAAAWETPADQSKAHFMRALYEQKKLVDLFGGAGIPFVIIKGTAAAVYYPAPSCRTMGDVDLLTTEEHFDRAFSLLKENGYEFLQDYGDGRDYAVTKGGVVFELHRRYSDGEKDIERYLRAGIAGAETLSVYGVGFPALPKRENGLVLLDHIRHHLFGGLGLRQILDFMMFVNSVPDGKVFENEYLPLYEECGLGTLAKVITKACRDAFGLPAEASWCDAADAATCEELLEKVYAGGNFGRKTPYEYRPMQNLAMSAKEKGFFRTLQDAGTENCEAFRKHRILRPFAWIYQLFRYAKRGAAALFRGEKLAGDAAAGREKADFFKRLGIN